MKSTQMTVLRKPNHLAGAVVLAMSLLVTPAVPAYAVGFSDGHSPTSASDVDLAAAVAEDGLFRGAPGLEGAVDMSAWTLVSDLEAGGPPRFARATESVTTASSGSWFAHGASGSGNGAINGTVMAVAVSGSKLYVGGIFNNAGGNTKADHIAVWNGTTWSNLGALGSNGALNDVVYALTVSNGDLYAGGDFTNAAGLPKADYIAKWNGSSWSALGGLSGNGALNNPVWALASSGGNVYAGGDFWDTAGLPKADYVARWDGTWHALGGNGTNAALGTPGDFVRAIAIDGNRVYVGGDFQNAMGIPEADYVAVWNGTSWAALGSNNAGDGALNDRVHAIATNGAEVYVGGAFTDAANLALADRVAVWDGSNWDALGGNGRAGAINDWVRALVIVGNYVFVGGQFTDAAGIAEADYIARWDGSTWSALGSNGAGDGALNNFGVRALAMSGYDLEVGGSFLNAAGIAAADAVAYWSGAAKPDGRIRKSGGPYVGNNIYNGNAAGQIVNGSAGLLQTMHFDIRIQNDGTLPESFLVSATGPSTGKFTIDYEDAAGSLITSDVDGAGFKTPYLPPASPTYHIRVSVRVEANATSGAQIGRLVTISALGNPSTKDAVKFIAHHP